MNCTPVRRPRSSVDLRLHRARLRCYVRLVEHPCHQCQALVDEGIAFCPHCGAPQIRVVSPEEDQATSPSPVTLGPPGEFPSPVQPSSSWSPGTPSYPPPQFGEVRWELAWQGALLAGAGAAILTAIPFVSLGCCLWMLGAGALAVALYQRRAGGTLVTPGMGLKIGALAGAFAFVINAAVTTSSFLFVRSSGDFHRALQEQMEKQMAATSDPKAQEIMQRMMDWIGTPQGIATLIVVILVVLAVMFVIFTAAGGALGASMFGRRREFR